MGSIPVTHKVRDPLRKHSLRGLTIWLVVADLMVVIPTTQNCKIKCYYGNGMKISVACPIRLQTREGIKYLKIIIVYDMLES